MNRRHLLQTLGLAAVGTATLTGCKGRSRVRTRTNHTDPSPTPSRTPSRTYPATHAPTSTRAPLPTHGGASPTHRAGTPSPTR
ncbi:hypothetical protein Lfu02_24410 [Longispora fulva]|uniref:Uncharacterized protein n=1 Tax=Longispora fulva TaxID=619741 RepID=A0A8J7GF75_9ACTN|nr:hypothetical protein [Longispora fulva]MBG6139548.1 hypothetical protein [Longispora fulva]GIG58069.1 hypothetical protein Lfu02_24410 [Longispora fulva]